MYAFLLLASLTEVPKIFKRGHFVSKLTTTLCPKQTRTRMAEGKTVCFLIKGHIIHYNYTLPTSRHIHREPNPLRSLAQIATV